MRLRLREDAPGLLSIEPLLGSSGRRLRALMVLTGFFSFASVPAAVADGDHWWCSIPMVCEAKESVDFLSDPLGYLAQKFADANMWLLGKLLELMQHTTEIDLTSSGFLKQYALIFAASTFLTVALWLIAVTKRAVRGVPLGTAVSEAVGFLVLQFVVNALTPGALALLMKAVDQITQAFVPGATDNFKPFLASLIKALAVKPDTEALALIAVNLVMLLGAMLMWIELLIRGAAIYVATALGPLVNAGLVDRDLWGKTKKWAGAIFAIALSKPVLFALLGLGGAILNDSSGPAGESLSKILIGALILLLAVFASAVLYKWIPAFGDEMADLHHARKAASSSGPASAVDGPAGHANRAMGMHVQDSLVGGRSKGGGGSTAGAGAAGGTGTAGAGTSATSGGAASAGPAGAAAAVTKAGVDLAKDKATSSPIAQGPDSAGTGAGQPDSDPPAQAGPSTGSGGNSVVPSRGAPPPHQAAPADLPPTRGAQPPPPPRDQ